VIRLQDAGNSVSIDTDLGNNACSMVVDGHEFIWTPKPWTAPSLAGIPLLAPWANRLDAESYSANGSRYSLNPSLGNLRFDSNHLPIHGLLAFASGWKVVRQDTSSVTSRLEFWRFPKWMAQFPFAHAIEITHRLRATTLEVETAIENLCAEPIPLCVGFHPYFQLTDSPRDEWRVHIAARARVGLSPKLIPTEERSPMGENPVALRGIALDAVFTDLTGNDFAIEGPKQRLTLRFGAKYPIAIVYAPANGSFVCIEPMTALTNAFNGPESPVPHAGVGETWRESFWISVKT
jgi:aldose 1-epimerase